VLIESEATTVVGAGPYERCEGRVSECNGHREMLGLDGGDSEDKVFWRGFLRSLRSRASAACSWSSRTTTADWWGRAIGRYFQGRPNGRSSPTPPKRRSRLSGTTWPLPWANASPRALTSWRAPKRRCWLLAPSRGPTVRHLWSTNPFERLIRELKRRCRVVGILSTEVPVIGLGGAILVGIHDEWVSGERRYFSKALWRKSTPNAQ
jgi:putative transposase